MKASARMNKIERQLHQSGETDGLAYCNETELGLMLLVRLNQHDKRPPFAPATIERGGEFDFLADLFEGQIIPLIDGCETVLPHWQRQELAGRHPLFAVVDSLRGKRMLTTKEADGLRSQIPGATDYESGAALTQTQDGECLV